MMVVFCREYNIQQNEDHTKLEFWIFFVVVVSQNDIEAIQFSPIQTIFITIS